MRHGTSKQVLLNSKVDQHPLTYSYILVSEFFVLVIKFENIKLLLGDKMKEIQPYAT